MRMILGAVAVAAATAMAAAAGTLPSFTQVDVSNAPGTQAEVADVVDPSNPDVLLAASNSLNAGAKCSLTRVYTSADGGATWSSLPAPRPVPVKGIAQCSAGDPGVAIDAHGREYLSFLSVGHNYLHQRGLDILARLQVASRDGMAGAWTVAQVYPVRSFRFDDKPAIAVDTSSASPHAGRVYVAWTRVSEHSRYIAISHSDDGGATWARPANASGDIRDAVTFASLGIDAGGAVFATWTDAGRRVLVSRSADGQVFEPATVIAASPTLLGPNGEQCGSEGAFAPPAQALRCVTSTPQILVDSRAGAPEQVYLTYSTPEPARDAQDVVVAKLDPVTLHALGTHTVHPADAGRDEFQSASAVDEAGRLWTCYFDSAADLSRRSVVYTCTASADGGLTWATPRAVALVPSDETGSLALDFQFGDYQGLAVAGGVAHPIWTDARQLDARREEIYTTTLTAADLQLP